MQADNETPTKTGSKKWRCSSCRIIRFMQYVFGLFLEGVLEAATRNTAKFAYIGEQTFKMLGWLFHARWQKSIRHYFRVPILTNQDFLGSCHDGFCSHCCLRNYNKWIHLQDLGASCHMDSSGCSKMLECSRITDVNDMTNVGSRLLKACCALDVTICTNFGPPKQPFM